MGEGGRESTPAQEVKTGMTTRPTRLLLFCAFLYCGVSAALADSYPIRPVRLIVPFAPGGAVDPLARLIAEPLGLRLGQPLVIYDRGGAGGSIGMDEVAKAPPDGYTLLLDHSGMTYMPALYRQLPFDPVKDLDGVITAVSGLYVLAVNPDLPVKSVAELIAYAKANPGRLSYGSAGIGSTLHLAAELLQRAAGIAVVHVPYKGAAPAATDLIAGQIQMMFGPATLMLPLAQAGKTRALAVTSPKRSALAPQLPAMTETLPGFEVVGWYGLAAPAGTPKEVIARLNEEANKVLETPDIIARLRLLSYEPIGGTPQEAGARIKADIARWTKTIHDAGIEPQ
jgi:tripartite-type tricarboxylate transporter receptor subunit TctC